MKVLICPTEAGYDINDIKRAALVYDKIFLLHQDDRDLFPKSAFLVAMGMPPFMSTLGQTRVRPLGKTANYDLDFEMLLDACRPLIDEGVVEVTNTWNREEADRSMIGHVPLGGYELNVHAVLHYYRSLAKSNDMLISAIDSSAIDFASAAESHIFSEVGQADFQLNGDPPLPVLAGLLQREEIRHPLSVIARSRIASALKIWGVAEQRGLIPALPKPSAAILDRVGRDIVSAIDVVEQDPYWSRRTAILDIVLGEYVPDNVLEKISSEDLLRYRTSAMAKAALDRAKLFSDLRGMAAEKTNLDLNGFRDRVRERLKDYEMQISKLRSERAGIKWNTILELGKISSWGLGGVAASGIFHVPLPVSLSAALFTATAWGLGEIQKNLPNIRKILAEEEKIKGANEFAVFRNLRDLKVIG